MQMVRIGSGFECSSARLAKSGSFPPLHQEEVALIHIPCSYFSLKGFDGIQMWHKEYLISYCIHGLYVVKPLLSPLLTLIYSI